MPTTTVFLLMLTLAAVLLGWVLTQWLVDLTQGSRRRIKERLGTAPLTRPAESAPLVLQRPVDEQSSAFGRRLVQLYPEATLGRFLALSLAMGAFFFAAVQYRTGSLFGAVLSGALIGVIPAFVVHYRWIRRQRLLGDQLCDAVDFLSRVLQAGHSLSTGLQMVGDELPEPISREFRRCYDQHSLGQPLEMALTEMAARVESTDFAFFATAILIQRQTGGDLAEILGNISTMVRARIRLQQHVKAITAEGRLTGYLLLAFPVVLLLVMNFVDPDYAGVLLHTSTGKKMLAIGAVLQCTGLFFIRRIITVKV